MNTYLQRADDFIQKQIYKYEQKRQWRDYHEMQSRHRPGIPPSKQIMSCLPPQGPPAPNGWSQEFDPQSQRWYYLERSTGHSQWDPPSFFQSKRAQRYTLSENHRPPPYTSRDEEMARRLQEEEENRGRSSSHRSPPQSGHPGVQQQQQRPMSSSPHPSPHGRLPPGAHLDMRTGQVVTNMFPEEEQGHWLNVR